jgi:alkylation response protein AidB-like acyl-CoA dehydrogenase
VTTSDAVTESEAVHRAEARAALSDPKVRAALEPILARTEPEPDVRELYRELARLGLLAVHWPKEYGGRGARHADAAAVIEELVFGGVPDMVHVLSIQIVGLFILMAGTAEQKARHLPRLAAADSFATVLYTEPDTGSDLASLATRAEPDGDGYRLTGVKMFGLKSGHSDLALCAARASEGRTKYEGISLFLVDLHAPGVHRAHLAGINDDTYDHVELDGVPVAAADLLGEPGRGWALLTRCLAVERVGLDYSLKARRWFAAATAGLDPAAAASDGGLLEQIGRLGARAEAGRLLAWDMIGRLDRDEVDPTASAVAKYYTSENAQEIALWAAETHGPGHAPPGRTAADAAVLESAYREAPGVTLSAGTSQMMLELVASSAFARPAPTGAVPGSVDGSAA